jgi:hypothetical protein
VQYNVGILSRRLYGRYLALESKQLKKRIREVKNQKFDKELKKLMKMEEKALKKLYYDRDME